MKVKYFLKCFFEWGWGSCLCVKRNLILSNENRGNNLEFLLSLWPDLPPCAVNGGCKSKSSAKYLLFFRYRHSSEVVWWEKKTKQNKKKPLQKVRIFNFFVSMRISVGCLLVLISGDFLVPLLDICWTKWRKCGLGCIFDVNIHHVFTCVCTSCLIHAW